MKGVKSCKFFFKSGENPQAQLQHLTCIHVAHSLTCSMTHSPTCACTRYKSPVKPIKASGKDVPPDLWIHQPSHMELQHMDKGRRSESSVSVATSTLPRGSEASTDRLDDLPPNIDVDRGDRRRNSFVGEWGCPCLDASPRLS